MLQENVQCEDKVAIALQDHIIVSIRIRPFSNKESSQPLSWLYDESSIQLMEENSVSDSTATLQNYNNSFISSIKQSFKFDHIFHPIHTNEYIYNSMIQKIVHSSMNGYHGTIFTYGQTSSGKTFTMNGDSTQMGIMFQAINDCFELIHSYQNREFLLRMSYLEVYNEQIKDLLNTDPSLIKLQYDAKQNCTVLSGVKEHVILNPQQAFSLITAGEAHRHVGSTDMNEKSSRAHTLLKIIIESKESTVENVPILTRSNVDSIGSAITVTEPTDATESHIVSNNAITVSSGAIRTSTLYLVDLAGSESAKMTNSKGQRAKEARYINQSLLTLSTIIQRLSEEKLSVGIGADGNSASTKRSQHLPYRDSKLTRILENALDGNALIGMICTISPTVGCIDETLNTLKFASRAKLIKIGAKLNETVDDKTLLRAYRDEIEQLRSRLKQLEESNQQNNSNNFSSYKSSRSNLDYIEEDQAVSTTEQGLSVKATTGAEDEDGEFIMLQMISEIERLIIKADISKSPRKSNASNIFLESETSSQISNETNNLSLPPVIQAVIPVSLSPMKEMIRNPRVTAIPSATLTRYDDHESQGTLSSEQLILKDGTSSISNSSRRLSKLAPKGSYRTRPLSTTVNKIQESDENDLSGVQSVTSTSSLMQRAPSIKIVSEQIVPTTATITTTTEQISVPSTKATLANEDIFAGVSKMLSLLKSHLAKSSHQRESSAELSSIAISTPKKCDILDIMDINSNIKNRIELLPVAIGSEAGTSQGGGMFSPTDDVSLSSIPMYHYQQLLLDLKLKDADNRFLQEELENKDQMLQMLTDGLKEIEQSQNLWLNRNQELSYALQKELSEKKLLQNEIIELKKKLQGI